jgi:hypothetical protein
VPSQIFFICLCTLGWSGVDLHLGMKCYTKSELEEMAGAASFWFWFGFGFFDTGPC